MYREQILSIMTEQPQLQSNICEGLKLIYDIDISTRELRKQFKAINQEHIDGTGDVMIISNTKGSYISKTNEERRKFNENRKHQALSLLYGVYQSEKRMQSDANLSFKDWLNNQEKVKD